MKDGLSERLFEGVNLLIMVILGILFIYPLWSTLVLSFSTPTAASSLNLRLYPTEISLGPYRAVFNSDIIWIGYKNTITRTLLGTFMSILVTYCAAYALTKQHLPYRKTISVMILITMFFSGGLIPSFLLVRQLGLIESIWALVLPGLTSAWNILIARNFIRSLPESIEESAMIDGAHPIVIVFRIMLPLSMPILAVLILWSAVGHWNAWFDAMIYIRERQNMVLQLVLRKILIENSREVAQSSLLTQSTLLTTPETVKAATIILSIGPIIAIYPFLQKYFVKGILIGAIKG
jgi:putative aldouronate transport system permease protein